MEESILISVKKSLGLVQEYDAFDHEIIMHINSVFSILFQLGVGEKPFRISDSNARWKDFLHDDTSIELVKTYVEMRVKMLFDPPLSSSAAEAITRQISEFEWRINVAVDPKKLEE